MTTIGKNIRSVRINRGLSQEQLAQALGVTKATISRYENGNREPRNDQLKLIAKILDVTAAHLQGYETTNNELSVSTANLKRIIDCINESYDEITYEDCIRLTQMIQIFSTLNDRAQIDAIIRLENFAAYIWNGKKEPPQD